MFKKLLAVAMVLMAFCVLPLLSGCEKNEYKSHSQSETVHSETHEVVE